MGLSYKQPIGTRGLQEYGWKEEDDRVTREAAQRSLGQNTFIFRLHKIFLSEFQQQVLLTATLLRATKSCESVRWDYDVVFKAETYP